MAKRYNYDDVMLQYWDENNEKLTIDNDQVLDKAITCALKRSYDEKLPQCQLKLLVTPIEAVDCTKLITQYVDYQCPECGQSFKVTGPERNTMPVICPRCHFVLERTLPSILYSF